MNINFNGYGENVATFLTDDTVQAGVLVNMKDNGQVTACKTGEDFIGVCVNTRDGYAGVQIAGYMEVESSAEIGIGYKGIVADGSSTIKTDDTATKRWVIYSKNNKIGFIL